MKRILITGNSGYIGSHLTKILNKRPDLELYGLDKTNPLIKIKNFSLNDITADRYDLENIHFDCVIHLAAEVVVGQSVSNPILYYSTNTLGTLNVLERIKTKNFVFASTGAAEGLGSPYGISKRMAEDIVTQYCNDHNLPFTIFRFYNVIGRDEISPTNIDGLFYNLINSCSTGKFKLFGNDYSTKDGTCERDYVHVNEICIALEEAITRSTNQIENLGHGKGHTVQEIVDIFKKVNCVEFEVEICPRRHGDLERSVLSSPSSFMKQQYSIEEVLKINDNL